MRVRLSIKNLLIFLVIVLIPFYFFLAKLHQQQVALIDTASANNNININHHHHHHHPAGVTGAAGAGSYYQKPKLEQYIHGWNITKNVNWLLDFAIVGFPKSGTSTLMLYLKNQTQSIKMFHEERCEMGYNQHVPLLVDLYKSYEGPHIKMGIKCPRDLEVDIALSNYHTYFPKTKFIIGIRHPILWFQSFYNFRITNEFPMPTQTNKLIGRCKKINQGVCTERSNFSKHLSKIESSRQVFIYDVTQLQDTNIIRTKQFRQDLQEFLNLQIPLHDTMLWIKPGHIPTSSQHANELKSLQINICDPQHDPIRTVLLQQAISSSHWIQDTFLTNPNVKVSSPTYFTQLLNRWLVDPCTNNNNSTTTIQQQ